MDNSQELEEQVQRQEAAEPDKDYKTDRSILKKIMDELDLAVAAENGVHLSPIETIELRGYILLLQEGYALETQEIKDENKNLIGIIQGMYPLWIAAMSWAENGRFIQLDAIRDYYKSDNPLTNEEIRLMFSLVPDKEK